MASNNALCSTCASSLLTSSLRSASSHPRATSSTWITPCCGRPICSTCLQRNPRLKSYVPCLGCLGGVGAVAKEKEDEDDIWVLGEEDEDDEESGDEDIRAGDCDEDGSEQKAGGISKTDAEDSHDGGEPDSSEDNIEEEEGRRRPSPSPSQRGTGPRRHFLKPTDTLLGLAFKYNVDGYGLCRLNNLPTSTLRTTPHLLHTRTFILLPPTAILPTPLPEVQDTASRKKERAVKRFQCVTKEVDWDVARTYVSLAEDDDSSLSSMTRVETPGEKRKGKGKGSMQERAVDRYLDDEEWEAQERQAGRAGIRGAPWFEPAVGTSRSATRETEKDNGWLSFGWRSSSGKSASIAVKPT